jgi:hypothetical protein
VAQITAWSSLSSETNSCLAIPEIPRILYTTQFHGRFHMHTPPVRTLSDQFSPWYPMSFKIYFHGILPNHVCLLFLRFPCQNPTCTSPQQGPRALDKIARVTGDESVHIAAHCASRLPVKSSHLCLNYVPWRPILKHPQPTSFLSCGRPSFTPI